MVDNHSKDKEMTSRNLIVFRAVVYKGIVLDNSIIELRQVSARFLKAESTARR